MFPRNRMWLGLSCLCLALACLVVQGCGKGGDVAAEDGRSKKGKKGKGGGEGGPVPVEVAKVVRKDVPIDMTAVGNVEALSTVSVRPQVSGQLQEVFIEDGEYIEKGQKLFWIDPRHFKAQFAQGQAPLAR